MPHHSGPDDEPPAAENAVAPVPARPGLDGHRRDRHGPDPAVTDPEALLEEVRPLDVDGVAAVSVGTVGWLIALAVLLVFRSRLAESDAQWWLWVCGAGATLGVPGLWYVRRRRRHAGSGADSS